MDDTQEALNTQVGEEANQTSSPEVETKATEEVETPQEEATVESEEQTETETVKDNPSKKGASQRIRELNARAKSAEEKAASLQEKLAELTGSVEPTGISEMPQQLPQELVRQGEEIDANELGKRILAQATAIADLKAKQNEAVSRIMTEATLVLTKYPELDPDSDSFDKELSESVTEATLAHVKANPYNASPKKFVEKMMKPYQRAVTKEVGKVTENIAKQVSQTATRPTSVTTTGGKSYKEKSIRELEAELGFIN